MASVQIADVRKAYGSTQVIHGVDIDISDGEFVIWSVRRAAENRPCCA